MKSILIANRLQSEADILAKVIRREFEVSIITSPDGAEIYLEKAELILLDNNFTENSGIDFLMEILKKHYLPVLILTSENDPQSAVEALRVGASNYLVKTGNYTRILNITITESINKFSEREGMKQTIIALKKRVNELENRLGISSSKEPEKKAAPQEKKISLVDEIISQFKRGEINLPSVPQINVEFNQLIKKGASISELAQLLKQDIAISSKLINISNTAYYKGVSENKSLDDAINRLGLSTTRQYVEVISNRSIYTTKNKKFTRLLEELWKHSLACANATDIITRMLGRTFTNDPFTMALFHDIGKLILIQVIGELEIKGKFDKDITQDEFMKTLNMLHSHFGAVLLKRWAYPDIYIQIAMHHDNLSAVKKPTEELLIIHFANLLAKSMGFSLKKSNNIDLENSTSFTQLRLRPEEIETTKNQLTEIMGPMLGAT